MQVTETLSDGLKRAYTVVVPAADIESTRAARLTDLGKTLQPARLPAGQGAADRGRQRFGTAVNAEVLEESVSEATQQVLTERGLRPALQPKVDVVEPRSERLAEARTWSSRSSWSCCRRSRCRTSAAITLTRLQGRGAGARRSTRRSASIAQRNRTLEPIAAEELATAARRRARC